MYCSNWARRGKRSEFQSAGCFVHGGLLIFLKAMILFSKESCAVTIIIRNLYLVFQGMKKSLFLSLKHCTFSQSMFFHWSEVCSKVSKWIERRCNLGRQMTTFDTKSIWQTGRSRVLRKYLKEINTIASIWIWNYARIFFLIYYLFLEAHSFPRANCLCRKTDNVRGKISEHLFAPNGGYCLYRNRELII